MSGKPGAGLLFRGEPKVLDARARAAAPGAFVELADGWVHYELAGPADGQPVVLVTGFSSPYFIWDLVFEPLAAAGLRVLRFDLYGRGYSDRPDVSYDEDLFEGQLLGLISALELAPPVDLVGISMGGAICTVFCDRHPDKVRRLCLLDPAGFAVKGRPRGQLLRVPLLGEVLMAFLAERLLTANLMDDFRHPERFPDYEPRYRTQLQYRGFKRALLSTLRSRLVTGVEDAYWRVGRQERPVLLIWGREDRTIPFEMHTRVLQAMPRARFEPIDEAGHAVHMDRPDVVIPLLTSFLAA
jgi:pimeloyl-ACP methyl ester carboxylesterase